MNRFWNSLIEPALEIRRPRVLVEIGAETGKATEKLLNFCVKHDAVLHSIDPQPKFDVAAWQSEFGPRFIFHQERSLDALVKIGPCDAVLIDGDHNWYTAYHELRLIDEAVRDHPGGFPLIFLHDIGWPYGRRDLYYNPEDIPADFRQPHLRQGIYPGESELKVIGGFNAHLCNAMVEGGSRNGVLTAIEDFLRENNGPLDFLCVPGLQGLGVIIPSEPAAVSEALRAFLERVANDAVLTPFLETVERDRNSLQVRSAELGQRLEAERLRAAEQAQLLGEEKDSRREAEVRVQELEERLEARERALHEAEARTQAEVAALRAAADQGRQALEELRDERKLLRAALASERRLLRAELAAERDLLQAEFNAERDRLLAEAARQKSERVRLQAEIERREKAREIEEQQQVQQLQAAIEGVMLREKAYAESLLDAARRLAGVADLLARQVGQQPTKKGNRRLETAQRELHAVRRSLVQGARRLVRDPADKNGRAAPRYDSNRILPGRPASGDLHMHAIPANGIVAKSGTERLETVEIVICVHNALDDVKRCLASVTRHTDARHRVIVVDDGSDDECASYLRSFTAQRPHFTLLRNEEPSGYTKAANQGLRRTNADMVVLLNSDTIVTAHWLERLVECARSDPLIGIVGPLSNAASYQSVPERADPNGDWALNPPPPGWDVDQVAAVVALSSDRAFPRVPFVNGFCFAITRATINAIGYFDEEAFPNGFGEENDYCLRAADAGFSLAIADHAYVYHAKSRSYSHERRRELGKNGRSALIEKYGKERVIAGETRLREEPALAKMRQSLAERLKEDPPPVDAPSVLFLLPVSGGGGGAHSIVQEVSGMRRLGVEAQVAVRERHLPYYLNNYRSLRDAERIFFGYTTSDELQVRAACFSVVVATIYTSVPLLGAIAELHPRVIPAYYVQDYEPFFHAEGSPEWEAAARSYTDVSGAVLFAKTQWLCDLVSGRHGIPVHKVSPSLDHDVYYPPPAGRQKQNGRVRVAAMIRPRSKRRGAARTMEVLQKLVAEFGKGVDVRIFGCAESDPETVQLLKDFRFKYKNHGILKREEVAEVLRGAEIFLDLSDYQAFGRTGLEAMACGCAVVVPALGGTGEYAVDRENALFVDTSSFDACHEAARELVEDQTLRERLQQMGVAKAGEYSIDRAARSELELFSGFYFARQQALAVRENDDWLSVLMPNLI